MKMKMQWLHTMHKLLVHRGEEYFNLVKFNKLTMKINS